MAKKLSITALSCVILLAPGPGFGGEAEGVAQHEAWESVLALARALLAAGADVSVEGDPYARLLVGLIAEEFLEPQAAEGRRRDVSDARAYSRASARVILRPVLEQDDRLEQAFDTRSRSGVVRYERGTPESSEARPASVVALIAIGSRVARAPNAVRRRRQYPNSIFITVPTDDVERTAVDDFDSDIGREIRQTAEQRVTEAALSGGTVAYDASATRRSMRISMPATSGRERFPTNSTRSLSWTLVC